MSVTASVELYVSWAANQHIRSVMWHWRLE